jgi:hypothetical protein
MVTQYHQHFTLFPVASQQVHVAFDGGRIVNVCGLAGGRWERIEPLIVQTLCEKDVAVTVYDF